MARRFILRNKNLNELGVVNTLDVNGIKGHKYIFLIRVIILTLTSTCLM